MAKIVVIGSLNMDVVAVGPRIPVIGETIIGNTYFTAPGGKGNNQAFAAARLGAETAMLGRIGNDAFGAEMKDNLARVGCDVTGVGIAPGASGVALIFVAEDGHNSIVVVPGANAAFRPEHIEPASLRNAAVALLQLENPMETVVAAAKNARKAGARVILDPAPAPAQPLPGELLQHVDVLTPNETEACILASVPPSRLTPAQAVDVARKLRASTAAVIVKLGDQGCVVVDADGATLLPAPAVTAVDTVGAGDNFNGALAVGLTKGMSLREAAMFANNAAAWSVAHVGHGLEATPTYAQVQEFARGHQPSVMTLA